MCAALQIHFEGKSFHTESNTDADPDPYLSTEFASDCDEKLDANPNLITNIASELISDSESKIASGPAMYKQPLVTPLEICRNDWARTDYDNRWTHKHSSDYAKKLIPDLERAQILLGSVPFRFRSYVNARVRRSASCNRVGSDDAIDAALQVIEQILAVCKHLTATSHKRNARYAIRESCLELRKLWKGVTGSDFVERRWSLADGRVVNGTIAPQVFVELDAFFVQVMLQAIDPTLTVQQVRSGLIQSSKAK